MAALEEEDQIARDRQNEVEFTKSQSVIVSEAKMVEWWARLQEGFIKLTAQRTTQLKGSKHYLLLKYEICSHA